jgi:23S rRNA (cytidine1920-2'-O)/16S rRNA (cytidine1409-2'-O)-methyltransferase
MGRQRVDKLVVERGMVPTREKARRLIIAGEVLVNDTPVDKPGTLVADDAQLRLRHPPKPYVGRGGEKLEGALDAFALDVSGLHVLDVGASTGGFTDCLLQRGAAEVTALDVGRAQIHWKLYSDERVHVIEDVNARYLSPDDFPQPFVLIVIDVSFISLTKILPALCSILKPGGSILMLVKPQFELSPSEIERGGLVKDSAKHDKAITSVKRCAAELGLSVSDPVASPITGATGNQEFFLLVTSNEN